MPEELLQSIRSFRKINPSRKLQLFSRFDGQYLPRLALAVNDLIGKVTFGQIAELPSEKALTSLATTHRLTPVDTSGRISIGKERAGTLCDVAYEPDGRVVLTPMVAIPERELWLHKNPTAKAMVEVDLAEMARGETVSIDLSSYPETDED
jgi:hypothetical protein